MRHEVEQALRAKVDDWEFRAAKQEIDRLKSKSEEMNRELTNVKSRNESLQRSLEGLIDVFMADSTDEILQNNLFDIKQNLY